MVALVILAAPAWRSLHRHDVFVLVSFAIPPVLVVGLASVIGPFGYNVRHVVWASIPILTLMGVGLARASGPRRWIAAGLIAVVSMTAVSNRITDDAHRNEDSRALAAYLSTVGDSDPVFVLVDYMAAPVAYYVGTERIVLELGDVTASGDGLPDALLTIEANSPNGRFWLAVSRDFHGDPAGMVVSALSRDESLESAQTFAGFMLYRGALR
jgi:hypothetical protein